MDGCYPTEDVTSQIPAAVLAQVKQAMSCSATGSPVTVKEQLRTIIDKYQPDELMVTGMIHDHTARVRSFEIAATVLAELRVSTTTPDPMLQRPIRL